MKKLHLILLLTIVFAFILQPIAAIGVSAAEEDDRSYISDIGSDIRKFVSDNSITTAGMSVAVFSADETLYKEHFGYMDVQNEIAVSSATVMEWGSVSKLLVWISVMQLVEQGKIDLDIDISEYLPDNFLRNRSYDKPITMLNLMNHNAGFEDSILGMATGRKERIVSLEEFLREIQPEQIFEPGSITAYSNWGTTLAAYIVECISGIPYYRYVRDNIFEPLQMNDTTIAADLSDDPNVEEKRMELKIYTSEVEEITPNISYIIMYPAGMCVSTLEDMQKFAQTLLDENTILFRESATYHELFTPSSYFGDTEIGRNYHGFWALEQYGVKVIGHNGNTAGCSSSLLLDLDNHIGMVVQTNQSNEQIYNLEMPELVFGKYEGAASEYEGLIMSPRTIFGGPLKLYKLLSVSIVQQGEPARAYDVRTASDNIDKISGVYSDYLVIGFRDVAADIVFTMLYFIVLLFCLINLVGRFILGLTNKIRGRTDKKALSGWGIASSLIQFIPFVIYYLMIPTFFSFQQWSLQTYRFAFLLIFLSALAMAAMIIYGFVNIRNSDAKKSRKRYVYFMNICMAVTIINIVYWDWFMFWRI